MNYYCDKCKGTTKNCETCDNPSCPNQPCCGRPLRECDCNPLTETRLIEIEIGSVFALGEIENDQEKTWLYNFDPGIKLLWLAKRGVIHDWTIYIGPAKNGKQWVLDYGNKITDEKMAKKLVPMKKDAWKMYRR